MSAPYVKTIGVRRPVGCATRASRAALTRGAATAAELMPLVMVLHFCGHGRTFCFYSIVASTRDTAHNRPCHTIARRSRSQQTVLARDPRKQETTYGSSRRTRYRDGCLEREESPAKEESTRPAPTGTAP